MSLKNWLRYLRGGKNPSNEARQRILEVLRHRYVRESQHVMRFRQHAERIAELATREALLRMAWEEEEHVRWLEEKIVNLGGEPPKLVTVHFSHEKPRDYLYADLADQRRCVKEIEDDKEALKSEFPELVSLLDRIEADAEKNCQEIRSLLSDNDELPWAA